MADLSRNCKGFRARESVHARVTEPRVQGTGVGRDIRKSPSRVRSVFLLIYAPVTVPSEYHHSILKGTLPCSNHSSTAWHETYVAGLRNLDVYAEVMIMSACILHRHISDFCRGHDHPHAVVSVNLKCTPPLVAFNWMNSLRHLHRCMNGNSFAWLCSSL